MTSDSVLGGNGAEKAPWMEVGATSADAAAESEHSEPSGDESNDSEIPLEATSATDFESRTKEADQPAADSDDDLSAFLKNLGS